MSEKEKMLKGEIYNPLDNELINERVKCKLLCQEYNSLKYDDTEKRTEILKQIFVCSFCYLTTILII